MIVVDDTHLLGKYPDVFFCASSYDGNKSLFTIAFGLTESKNGQNLDWFLVELRVTIGDIQNQCRP